MKKVYSSLKAVLKAEDANGGLLIGECPWCEDGTIQNGSCDFCGKDAWEGRGAYNQGCSIFVEKNKEMEKMQ